MKEIIKLSVALGVICAVASSVLAFAERQTRAATETAELAVKQEALQLVLPEFDNQPLEDKETVTVDNSDITFYRARRDGQLVGTAAEASTDKGFGGTIKILVGFDENNDITTVLVTDHKETPGLGTAATDRKQKKSIWDVFTKKMAEKPYEGPPPSEYLDQYTGMNLVDTQRFAVDKEGGTIDAISGATVSSRAVADAVSRVADALKQQ